MNTIVCQKILCSDFEFTAPHREQLKEELHFFFYTAEGKSLLREEVKDFFSTIEGNSILKVDFEEKESEHIVKNAPVLDSTADLRIKLKEFFFSAEGKSLLRGELKEIFRTVEGNSVLKGIFEGKERENIVKDAPVSVSTGDLQLEFVQQPTNQNFQGQGNCDRASTKTRLNTKAFPNPSIMQDKTDDSMNGNELEQGDSIESVQDQFSESLYFAAAFHFAIKPSKWGNLLMAFSYFLTFLQLFSLYGFILAVLHNSNESEWISFGVPIALAKYSTDKQISPDPYAVSTMIDIPYSGFEIFLDWAPSLLVCMLVGHAVFQEVKEAEIIAASLKQNKVSGCRRVLVVLHNGYLRAFVIAIVTIATAFAVVGFGAADILLNGLALFCVLEVDNVLFSVFVSNPRKFEEEATFPLSEKEDRSIGIYARIYGFASAFSIFVASLINFDAILQGMSIDCEYANCASSERQVMATGFIIYIFTSFLLLALLIWLALRGHEAGFKILFEDRSTLGWRQVALKYLTAISPAVTVISIGFIVTEPDLPGYFHEEELESQLLGIQECVFNSSTCDF